MVFPVFWMISTALKPDDEINSATPTWFSFSPTLEHFRDAMDRPYFWDTVQNSLIIVSVAVVASIVIAFLAAVALAKYRFWGRKAPHRPDDRDPHAPASGARSSRSTSSWRSTTSSNTMTGVILTYLTFVLPFAVWTLRGFIVGIPKDWRRRRWWTARAASGRSCASSCRSPRPASSRLRCSRSSRSWNEYIFASVLLSDQSDQTVTVWLAGFYGGSRNTDWGGLMAASTLTAIPVIVFFLLVQRRIMFGLTAGAVRG